MATFDLSLHQMDIKCAFLNGEPQEEIFIKTPEEVDVKVPPGYGLRLGKSLYGLKQSPRCWYTALSSFFLSLNFVSSEVDPCLFIHSNPSKICVVFVHVDNLVIGGVEADVMEFKSKIKDLFEMEDMGECGWVLGMRVTRNRENRTISLHQDK